MNATLTLTTTRLTRVLSRLCTVVLSIVLFASVSQADEYTTKQHSNDLERVIIEQSNEALDELKEAIRRHTESFWLDSAQDSIESNDEENDH